MSDEFGASSSEQPVVTNCHQSFEATQAKPKSNLLLALGCGLATTLICAATWAAITIAIEYQIGWMAIGVGALVGFVVRITGKGSSQIFGVIGAVMAFLGCVLGNLFFACQLVANEYSVSFWEVLSKLTPSMAVELLQATFHPMDLLFYGLAIFEGYKLSIHPGTAETETVISTIESEPTV